MGSSAKGPTWLNVSSKQMTAQIQTTAALLKKIQGNATSQTRPKSFRSRSTIMRFSALALAEESRVALDSWSSCGLTYLRAVPLMGRASTSPSADPFRNLSGEEQQIWQGMSAFRKHGDET